MQSFSKYLAVIIKKGSEDRVQGKRRNVNLGSYCRPGATNIDTARRRVVRGSIEKKKAGSLTHQIHLEKPNGQGQGNHSITIVRDPAGQLGCFA